MQNEARTPATRGRLLGAAIGLALLAGACGGGPAGTAPQQPAGGTTAEVNPKADIPDNQSYVLFSPASGGFTVKVPEGWARTDEGSAVTFTDKLNRIRLEAVVAPAPPTVDSARATGLASIKGVTAGYQGGEVTTVQRPAGGAVLIRYQAAAAPDPVTGKVVRDAVERYEFWRGGTEAIIVLSGPATADNVDPWRVITDSFRWR
jgi:hypothetical protein